MYDIFRVSRSENTWEAAVRMTMRLYLDFANFFIYLLQYLPRLTPFEASIIVVDR